MSNSKLIVRHLQKTYGKRTVVSNVSLDVSSGEVVGLLGPNGARENHLILYDCGSGTG